jgi:phosphatidylinositol phospholipase C delta
MLLDLTDPANILINISESVCMQLLPMSLTSLISHGCDHLRRIFPKGTRIDSSNLDPLVFWRNGSQIASLNWQVYDTGMHLNEAMFVGSQGWVPKPKEMRKEMVSSGASLKEKAKQRLVVEIVGVSSCQSCFPSSSFRENLIDDSTGAK